MPSFMWALLPCRSSSVVDEDGKLEAERAAQRSMQIDRSLQTKNKEILLLLLGPPNSGKSTFVRQMRRRYDNDKFVAEREAFRLAIYLSIIDATSLLLGLLERSPPRQAASPTSSREILLPPSQSGRPATGTLRSEASLRKLRLAPVLNVTESIRGHLGITSSEPGASPAAPAIVSLMHQDGEHESADAESTEVDPEPYTYQQSKWRMCLRSKFSNARGTGTASEDSHAAIPLPADPKRRPSDDPSYLLEGCRDEISSLFALCVNKGLVADEGPREGAPGGTKLNDSWRYYLTHLDRIATSHYVPSDEDIMRLRLRTNGVEDHYIQIEGARYKIVDVAGAHGTRPKWAPYFEDGCRAIIFIVSLGSYDESRLGFTRRPPLDDAIKTFQSICKNKLLQKSDMILFLNKVDILQKKIASGQYPPSKFCPDYKGPDEYEAFRSHVKARFLAKHNKASPINRVLYVHYTQATSVKASEKTLESVKDIIVRRNLTAAGLM